MIDRSKYYPKNATPVEKMIYDYKHEISMVEWCKEQVEHYKWAEGFETGVLEMYVGMLKNTKWSEKETVKIERKRAVDRQNAKVNLMKKKVLDWEKQVEEHLKNMDDLSQLMIEYDGYEKDELLKELKEIRWNNLKVDSGCFTTKPNKFYKYCK